MDKTAIKLSLDLAEVNAILKVLSKQPYEEVYQLINRIQNQAAVQLEAKQPALNGKREKVN